MTCLTCARTQQTRNAYRSTFSMPCNATAAAIRTAFENLKAVQRATRIFLLPSQLTAHERCNNLLKNVLRNEFFKLTFRYILINDISHSNRVEDNFFIMSNRCKNNEKFRAISNLKSILFVRLMLSNYLIFDRNVIFLLWRNEIVNFRVFFSVNKFCQKWSWENIFWHSRRLIKCFRRIHLQ